MASPDLECYDENGFVTLTAATLFGRVLGTFDTGTQPGSRYYAGLTSLGLQAWYMTSPRVDMRDGSLPQFTIANDTISWTFPPLTNAQGAPFVSINTFVIVGTD